ncbi:MAG: hypothetical protein JXQ73_30000 [Phycisphaerae bacterium]|nr:hypothetical protein [Phycisphaerae bacterium]
MLRTRVLAACLAIGLVAMAAPAYGETYYVEQDASSVNANLEVSFSASGFLKLVIFDPNNAWLDWLNPKMDAFAGIYAAKTLPSTAVGTLDADVAGGQVTLSDLDLDLLADGPTTTTAGADIHVDSMPQAIIDLLDPFLGQVDANWIDPNWIETVLDTLLGGLDFEYDFDMTVNSLTMSKYGDPTSATLTDGAFEGLITWANLDSEIQFNGGNAFDLPAVPLPFTLDGTYTDVPASTLTMASNASDGGVDTPEVVIIDQLITIPISGLDVTFQIHLQIDAGTASYEIAPSLTAVTGYALATSVDPVDTGSVAVDPAGAEFAPGTVVTVSATPVEGYHFSHWEGDLSGSTNPTTITMNTHKSVTAVFQREQVTLTVNTSGSGNVTLSPSGGNYEIGTVVTLTPVAGLGSAFDYWEGDIPAGQETANPLTLTMDVSKTVTAVFKDSSLCGTGAGMPLAVGLLCCTIAVIRRRR